MNDNYRDRHMGQPQLFCIIPAPQGLSWVTVNLTGRTMDEIVLHPQGGLEVLGDTKFTPIEQVGYSNTHSRMDNTRPHTLQWYEDGFAENWVNMSHHSAIGRPNGARCRCEYLDCDILGVETKPIWDRTRESASAWKELAAARLAGFQKREANRVRSREYQRERSKRLRTEAETGKDEEDGWPPDADMVKAQEE